MRKLLQLKRTRSQARLNQKIRDELATQLQLVGTLSSGCQQITQAQLQEYLPLLMTYGPRKVRGWQDEEHQGAALSLTFHSGHQLVLLVFCPPTDAAPWYADTKLFVYKGRQLSTYLACHHTQLNAALHQSLHVLEPATLALA
ncbi:hypothetical protein [Hymenobacter lucidus]|uniref:DUF1801 domain-containing protein n=1 Tax=Hymenobacter lucidus TaxID=2880930 RepID=A0ABS8AY90_9BACT|nr:hypothetical protein [Hymenobacter lucidus]MCB2410782.1 hypothetical protein [Hymenobacter lucidus]